MARGGRCLKTRFASTNVVSGERKYFEADGRQIDMVLVGIKATITTRACFLQVLIEDAVDVPEKEKQRF